MSLLLLIMLLGTLPFPILAAIEIADQYGQPHPYQGRRRRTVSSR